MDQEVNSDKTPLGHSSSDNPTMIREDRSVSGDPRVIPEKRPTGVSSEFVSEMPLDPPPTKVDNTWYCYILRNKQFKYRHLTYNGSTNNPKRRLRQHNEEISGGARYTHGRGGGWEIYALLTGFVDHKNALSCEWRIKHTSGSPRGRPAIHRGMTGRILGLNEVLRLSKWTNQCLVENAMVQYRLYIADDVKQYIETSTLPQNIEVIVGIPAEFL